MQAYVRHTTLTALTKTPLIPKHETSHHIMNAPRFWQVCPDLPKYHFEFCTAAQEIFKLEQEEQKKLEEDKQALLRELDAGINNDDKVSAAAILSGLAFLLLL